MHANLEAFERRRPRPRMLAGNVRRDLSVEVHGTRSPAPVLLAPVGVHSIAHTDAEVGAAHGAAAAGLPFVLSSAASSSIEQIAEAMEVDLTLALCGGVSVRDLDGSLLA
jgi:isopentenyl diphosphate isomerase/L-lactate dehydrogenase-like FMN-dependent dehydrogenase